jgi:hypothetical protein
MNLLKGCLALLFCAVELNELGKGHPWLKLDAARGAWPALVLADHSSGLSLLRGGCCLIKFNNGWNHRHRNTS